MSLENDLISMPSDRRNIDRNYVKLGLIKLLGCLAAVCVWVCVGLKLIMITVSAYQMRCLGRSDLYHMHRTLETAQTVRIESLATAIQSADKVKSYWNT